MANEFVARKGLIVPSGSNIWVASGSVTASQFIGTASNAVSSSFASYSVNGFPYVGDAVITGSLNVTQAVTASFFKGDGSQLINIPSLTGQSALRVDGYQFEADGVTTQYTLSHSIYSADELIVAVGGVVYSPTADYTFASNIITFNEAPPSSSNIAIRGFVAVTSGSVNTLSGSFSGSFNGTSSWADNAVTASYAANAELLDGKNSTIFATTGSNTFDSTQTINGNIYLDATFPLVYNSSNTNNMLFGFFDGGTIFGAYYQVFGTNYANTAQRGGAEFVYDVRSNSDANFHVASYNGSTWTEKFRVDDTGIIVTGSIKSTGGVTGSLLGTSSWASNAISSSYATTSSYAVTSSFASNVLKTKAGSVANTSFGGTPLTASVTFGVAFADTNYAIAVTGEDSRAWIVESKSTSGFTINSVSNTALTGTTYWTCTAYGEN